MCGVVLCCTVWYASLNQLSVLDLMVFAVPVLGRKAGSRMTDWPQPARPAPPCHAMRRCSLSRRCCHCQETSTLGGWWVGAGFKSVEPGPDVQQGALKFTVERRFTGVVRLLHPRFGDCLANQGSQRNACVSPHRAARPTLPQPPIVPALLACTAAPAGLVPPAVWC